MEPRSVVPRRLDELLALVRYQHFIRIFDRIDGPRRHARGHAFLAGRLVNDTSPSLHRRNCAAISVRSTTVKLAEEANDLDDLAAVVDFGHIEAGNQPGAVAVNCPMVPAVVILDVDRAGP